MASSLYTNPWNLSEEWAILSTNRELSRQIHDRIYSRKNFFSERIVAGME